MAKKKRKTTKKQKSKAKGRGRGRGRKKKGFLSGITTAVNKANQPKTVGQTGVQTALAGGAMIAGLVAGLAAGKYSLYAGATLAGIGVFARKPYLSMTGLAMALSPNVKSTASAAPAATVEGFDVKQIASDAKHRVGAYFKGFTEKLTFKPQSGMSGLAGDEAVTYFVNPYASRELPPGSLDMSALDRVQEQIALMSTGSGKSRFDEDISMRNF